MINSGGQNKYLAIEANLELDAGSLLCDAALCFITEAREGIYGGSIGCSW
jgi:hypothetical protein